MGVEGNNVARRTLAKGAAWSIPVIATAFAAPAASASTGTCSFTPGVAPILGQTNCFDSGVTITVGSGNVPAFGVSFLPTSCINRASWTVVYSGDASLSLNNFGKNAIGVSILSTGSDRVSGTFTSDGAVLPVLNTDLITLALGVQEVITLSVSDSSGTTLTTSMTFTVVTEAAGLALTYLSCTAA